MRFTRQEVWSGRCDWARHPLNDRLSCYSSFFFLIYHSRYFNEVKVVNIQRLYGLEAIRRGISKSKQQSRLQTNCFCCCRAPFFPFKTFVKTQTTTNPFPFCLSNWFHREEFRFSIKYKIVCFLVYGWQSMTYDGTAGLRGIVVVFSSQRRHCKDANGLKRRRKIYAQSLCAMMTESKPKKRSRQYFISLLFFLLLWAFVHSSQQIFAQIQKSFYIIVSLSLSFLLVKRIQGRRFKLTGSSLVFLVVFSAFTNITIKRRHEEIDSLEQLLFLVTPPLFYSFKYIPPPL